MTTHAMTRNLQTSGPSPSSSAACVCADSLGKLLESRTTHTDFLFRLLMPIKSSFSLNLDNPSSAGTQDRKVALRHLRETSQARSRARCVCFAYCRAKLGISSAVCLISTLVGVQPWMRFLPILGCRMRTCVDRKKEGNVITRPIIITHSNLAVAPKQHQRSRARLDIWHKRGTVSRASLS
jgi:hypothetical protein